MRVVALIVILVLPGSASSMDYTGNSSNWRQKLSRLVWVAYSPPTSNPDKGIEATTEAINEDLIVLHRAGFTGLVTYGASGVLGRELPSLAAKQGFKGIIMGVWDPASKEEMAAAQAAAGNPIVVGFCVGNEGLGQRYEFSVLSDAIQMLRKETGKPVTTTEIVEKYSDNNLFKLGDWVFPNAHPYFHGKLEPMAAVRWTKEAYNNLKKRGRRFLIFKEVGLPTAGDTEGKLSETAQERYYQELAGTNVRFVYFEAFDQPWKTHLPVEPHWGLFRSDRTPKLVALRLMRAQRTYTYLWPIASRGELSELSHL